jgi:hypothetical protein
MQIGFCIGWYVPPKSFESFQRNLKSAGLTLAATVRSEGQARPPSVRIFYVGLGFVRVLFPRN